jgi:tagatose 6-phosphate kinase
MILTVTLNPALDVTYWVDRLALRSATKVRRVRARAGGKGVNVARVAAAVHGPGTVCVTGLAGGSRGEAIREAIAALGVREEFEVIAGESRQTIAIVEENPQPTELREPGPTVTPREWDGFTRRFRVLAKEASVVVLSGSLPPGTPPDAYATLVRAAHEVRSSVIVDTSGPALWDACTAAPDIVKPNEAELPGVDTVVMSSQESVLAAARLLRDHGAGAVIASLGRAGSVAVTADGALRVSHPRVDGNPVGAGDALVAGLALALASGQPLGPAALARASGLAMASVAGSGEVDPAEAERLADMVRTRWIGDGQ